MKDLLKRLFVEEEGQGITEYALILGLIVFGVWVLIQSTQIGQSISTLFTNVKGQIDECSSDAGSCGGGGPAWYIEHNTTQWSTDPRGKEPLLNRGSHLVSFTSPQLPPVRYRVLMIGKRGTHSGAFLSPIPDKPHTRLPRLWLHLS